MELKYFRRIEREMNVRPFAVEIVRQPEAWFQQTGRQKVRVQAEALAIPLRGIRKSKIQGRKRCDVHETRYTTLSNGFPFARDFIEGFAQQLGGTLGRAKIVNLPPGRRVLAHVDRGDYYARRDRFHLVIESDGCRMRAGDEEVVMQRGELWWFDNKTEHEAWNETASPRIHLIFDIEPPNTD